MSRSISVRLTLSLATVSASMFLLAGVGIYIGLTMTLERATRDDLLGKVRMVHHLVDEAARSDHLTDLQHRMDDILVGHTELRVWLLRADGQPAYGRAPLPKGGAAQEGFFSAEGADGAQLEAVRANLVDNARLGISSAVVALDTASRKRLLRSLVTLMVGIGTAAMLLTVLLGWAAMARGLRPLRRLSEESAAISPNVLGRRLSTKGIDRELEEMATAFNGVLDRLEAAYRQVEAFNADVAHELRTPLASLISGTQLALITKRPVDQLLNTLASNLEDLEQLKSLINDMLFLAQADHGAPAQDMVPADLRIEVLKVIEFFEAWLSETRLQVRVQGSGWASCTPALIRRAVSNLLSNAIKYTPPGRTIEIVLEEVDGFVRIAVVNPGEPIDEEIRRRMFDRFFRADPARGRRDESHGLGLAIVRAIARMHNGCVFAENTAEGPRIGIKIRTSPPAAPQAQEPEKA